jgi:hypothetical protein
MAFKRTSAKALVSNSATRFSKAYKFSTKANFDVGKDAYILILGLESGYYETPCHRVLPHKVNGQLVGFGNTSFAVYLKCKGIDEEGNRTESLCCTLAQLEKDRIPDKEESGKRIVSFTTYRIHLPVLILGNSLADKKKDTYPVSKVSILNNLRSESGLNFAYIEMASSSFKKDIIQAYGKKLKEDGIIDYELDEESEEFMDEVLQRLPNTVVKVHGVSKQGFNAALKEYSFFPFDNASIASGSPEGEREAIINYRDNQEIQNKICEFLDLFNIEVDNMFNDWTEKDLQEYYNSAIGTDLKAPIKAPKEEAEEVVEEIEEVEEKPIKPVKAASKTPVVEAPPREEEEVKLSPPASDDEVEAILKGTVDTSEAATDDSLEEVEMSFDDEDEDSFFED